jgi:hypothetical protein
MTRNVWKSLAVAAVVVGLGLSHGIGLQGQSQIGPPVTVPGLARRRPKEAVA